MIIKSLMTFGDSIYLQMFGKKLNKKARFQLLEVDTLLMSLKANT